MADKYGRYSPRSRRKLICDVCGDEIERDEDDGFGWGMISWLPAPDYDGGRDFLVHHKTAWCEKKHRGFNCDRADRQRNVLWMELNEATGPEGLATLIHWLTEPGCDRPNLERLIHKLYFSQDGSVSPLVNPRGKRPLRVLG